ncbi:MAG: carbon-nitrogen family hydrolase [Deltaproteobacteria bacterium]|nr:carbon-nitrogen family hydrolase [Deltaproteobacteria bacterium]
MRVAAAQMDIAWHDREQNYTTARRMAGEAKGAGAALFVLPEMFSTGFSMASDFTAEPMNGPTPSFLRALAAETGMAVIGGFVLSGNEAGPQNVSLAVNERGDDLAIYAKIHQIALLGETDNYSPGLSPETFDLEGIRAACLICYDLRFPELFRSLADECGLVTVIASWPASRQGHWDLLLRARATENQNYVIGVNRVGDGGGLAFTGGSVVIDPLGEVLAKGNDTETLVIADIDPARVVEVRTQFPFLKDRKKHLLGK